jgi:hypothetical protein
VEALDQTLDWITVHRRVWDERFDKLDAHLRDLRAGQRHPRSTDR